MLTASIHSLANYREYRPVPVKHAPMAHHRAGLTWTASGYGARIPMPYMVQINGKWRRVYCRIYSNIGTLFIGKSIETGAIVEISP